VYDPESPTIDPALLAAGIPVLGICYGQQLITHLLGGSVTHGTKGEYGLAMLDRLPSKSKLFEGVADHSQVWMSHRDLVSAPAEGFHLLASTPTCPAAALEDSARHIYGVQFHPEKSGAAGQSWLASCLSLV